MTAFTKDILRTIRKEKKRFLALMIISFLGVTMVTGLKAACDDLRISANDIFFKQNLHDITVLSTLGLTESDVRALSALDCISFAEGTYSKKIRVDNGLGYSNAIIKTFTKKGIDSPYVTFGRLPKTTNEIAVSQAYMKKTGKKTGDYLIIKEKKEEHQKKHSSSASSKILLKHKKFKIVGVVIDVTNIVNPEGATSFRNEEGGENVCFVIPQTVKSDFYTAVNLTVKGSKEFDTFSKDYELKINDAKNSIDSEVTSKRQDARLKEIRKKAENNINKAEKKLRTSLSKAKKNLDEAKKKLDNGRRNLKAGETNLNQKKKTTKTKIQTAKKEILNKKNKIRSACILLKKEKNKLSQAENRLDEQKVFLMNAKKQIEQGQIIPGMTAEKVQEMLNQINRKKEKISEAEKSISKKYKSLKSAEKKLSMAEKKLNKKEIRAKNRFSAANKKLEISRIKLEKGQKEYTRGIKKYNKEKENAEEKIKKARKNLEDIKKCTWYIKERQKLGSFAAITNDADCIESIGTVFPIIFILIAVLISLTTITRMVEEHRGLIGTYQAMGFTSREIKRKFAIYSSVACITGGVLGNIGGYIILPKIMFRIFREMYIIPSYSFNYDTIFGIGSILLFYFAIVGTTVIACNSAVHKAPATLMRPKAPHSGSRILLENFKPLWHKMSFMNKATARNLFRYKKRFFMTVFGIAGCTALLLCGFSVKDTVADLLPGQYGNILSYDILSVTSGGDDFKNSKKYLSDKSDFIKTRQSVQVTSVDVHNKKGDNLSVQLYVVPDEADIDKFFTLTDINGYPVSIKNDGFYITQNISSILKYSKNENLIIQNPELKKVKGNINAIIVNYLGNFIFVTKDYYEKILEPYSPNAELLCLNDNVDKRKFAKTLKKQDEILSVSSIRELKDDFSKSFKLVNMVLYVVIILAGALAFVVLFTLSTTNISEREREIATIKVLGFHDNEVHSYINKESLILTGIGIAIGLPLGVLLSYLLGYTLKIPSIVFATVVHPISYLWAAMISFVFACIVNLVTNKILDRINPVEALKSVE